MMKAVQFEVSVPRYALSRAAGYLSQSIYTSRLSCLHYREVPLPPLPSPRWAVVRTRYGGICGSDLGLIQLHSSPATAPFSSSPFTLGHENVGTIEALGPEVRAFAPGERVVVNPLLSCAPREIQPPCPHCQSGDAPRCEHLLDGKLPPALITGSCSATGGSWSPRFLAHESQLVRVPDQVDDEAAVLAEPLSVAIRPVLRHLPASGQTVLIIGAGVIGLCVLAALRAAGSQARIIVLARHAGQARQAERLGASEVLRGRTDEAALARLLGARLPRPILGRPIAVGGAELVFECVGSSSSIDLGLRFTRAGGTMVLAGVAAVPRGIDWSPIWLKELTLQGTFCSGSERWQGQELGSLELALRWMAEGRLDLAPLVTHRFPLADYRLAIETASAKGRSGALKVVFDFGRA